MLVVTVEVGNIGDHAQTPTTLTIILPSIPLVIYHLAVSHNVLIALRLCTAFLYSLALPAALIEALRGNPSTTAYPRLATTAAATSALATNHHHASLRREQDGAAQIGSSVRTLTRAGVLSVAPTILTEGPSRGDGACGKTSLLNVFTRG